MQYQPQPIQQDPKAFADTMRTAAEVREHLAHVVEGIAQQKQHIHAMADSQTSWFQIKQNIKMLMHEETFQPTAATFETFGHATWSYIKYEKQLNLADKAMNELLDTKKALLTRLIELEPDAPEVQPSHKEPTGPHADTRVRKDEYPGG